MDRSILHQFEKMLGSGRIKPNQILAPYTTFKMGGPAEYYFEAETSEDIVNALATACKLSIKCTILGGISNVIISENGVEGLVIRNKYVKKEVVSETATNILLKVSSGYMMGRLVKETANDDQKVTKPN